MAYYIGIDLGGTNIVAGVVDNEYKIKGRASRKTGLPLPPAGIIQASADTALEAIRNAGLSPHDIAAAGIGVPGSVNPQSGVVEYSNNLGLNSVPFRDMLTDILGVTVYIANDANAAAYGEFLAGAGRGTQDFIAITLGTGVGGGIIINSRLYTGYNGAAGEIGHTVIDVNGAECTCGRRGCAEAYISATALIRRTREVMAQNPDSLMWKLAASPDNADGKTAFDAAKHADAAAAALIKDYIENLGDAVTNYINIFQPEKLCIGGGVSAQGEVLLKPLNALVKTRRYSRNSTRNTEIVISQMGNDAGIVGAAMLYRLENMP